jgi:hypothetical protein
LKLAALRSRRVFSASGKPEQIDLRAGEIVIIHRGEIDRAAGQRRQQCVGDAALDLQQARTDREADQFGTRSGSRCAGS